MKKNGNLLLLWLIVADYRSWNRLKGKLPSSLANLAANLQVLQIPSNKISGAVPLDVGNLASLQLVDLSDNLLSGAIPESIGKLTQLNE